MFVRIKTTPDSPRRSVQLVEGVREGGKIRQRILRRIGVAMDEDELEGMLHGFLETVTASTAAIRLAVSVKCWTSSGKSARPRTSRSR